MSRWRFRIVLSQHRIPTLARTIAYSRWRVCVIGINRCIVWRNSTETPAWQWCTILCMALHLRTLIRLYNNGERKYDRALYDSNARYCTIRIIYFERSRLFYTFGETALYVFTEYIGYTGFPIIHKYINCLITNKWLLSITSYTLHLIFYYMALII